MNRLNIFFTAILLVAVYSVQINYAQNGTITGKITAADSKAPLPGANVSLQGTTLGAATDLDGNYKISNIPRGNYTLKVSFIGYESRTLQVTVGDKSKLQLDFVLKPESIEGEEVIVTAQAIGQMQAINKQLSDNKIINVVSSARIQEVPDANAAESVGRLPGVSVLRSGGEGNKIVVRGLAPKFNQIKISGIQMSGSDPNNRSTDLSMISSNMLEGIEVSKTVTPDMDANVIGGVVNFELKEARSVKEGVGHFALMAQGGYTNLANARNKFNNYKYMLSFANRFFNEKFGLFAQVDIERKNLTSNELGANYDHLGNSTTDYIITGLNLYHVPRDRQRYNGALVLDYKLPEGKIKLVNFFSSGNTKVVRRGESFDISNNLHSYTLTNSENKLTVVSNSLSFEQSIFGLNMKSSLSHSYSENKNPNGWTGEFVQTSAGLGQFNLESNLDPKSIPKAANNNFGSTFLHNFITNQSFTKEQIFSFKSDFDFDLNLSEDISMTVKFGGDYSHKTKYYNYDQFDGQGLDLASAQYVDNLIITHFGFPQTLGTTIPLTYFGDANFDYGEFLGGDYNLAYPLNYGMMYELSNLLKSNYRNILENNGAIAYGPNNFLSTTNDYEGFENQSGFYLMTTIRLGEDITFIPGIRYQHLKTSYTAARGIESPLNYYDYNHYDTTVVKEHGYWLPDVILRYKPVDWFDVRVSLTNTLSYPDYNAIIPRIDVATSSIAWNNFDLNPSRATNYDLYLSFYSNYIGLFTFGGFLKEIKDLIYPWTFYVSGEEALKYFPPGLIGSSNPRSNYRVDTYVNNSFLVKNWGLEVDWQTHFWYLPGFLSGFVLNVNYTHIFSEAEYPYTIIRSTGRQLTIIDTSYTDRLLYQPDNIVNISLGYDYKDFSIRVSMLYQADIFTGPNFWPQLRSSTAAYTRFDVSLKQNLPWYGIQIYGNVNNLNKVNDISVIQRNNVPQSQQDYGMTIDFGLRWKL